MLHSNEMVLSELGTAENLSPSEADLDKSRNFPYIMWAPTSFSNTNLRPPISHPCCACFDNCIVFNFHVHHRKQTHRDWYCCTVSSDAFGAHIFIWNGSHSFLCRPLTCLYVCFRMIQARPQECLFFFIHCKVYVYIYMFVSTLLPQR